MSEEIPFVSRGLRFAVARALMGVVCVAVALANTLHQIRFGMARFDIGVTLVADLALVTALVLITRKSLPRRAFMQGLLGAPLALALANWLGCALLWGPSSLLRPVWSEILFGIVPACALHGVLVGAALYVQSDVRLRPSHDALDRVLQGVVPLAILGLLDACVLVLHRPFPQSMLSLPAADLASFVAPALGPALLGSVFATLLAPLAVFVRDERRLAFVRALTDASAWSAQPAAPEDTSRLLPWVLGHSRLPRAAALERAETASGTAFRESTPRARVVLVPADLSVLRRDLRVRMAISLGQCLLAAAVTALVASLRW